MRREEHAPKVEEQIPTCFSEILHPLLMVSITGSNPVLTTKNKLKMKVKVYYENDISSMGGYEIVSIFKLMWWIFLGRIKPNDKSDIYYIRKIETITGRRI